MSCATHRRDRRWQGRRLDEEVIGGGGGACRARSTACSRSTHWSTVRPPATGRSGQRRDGPRPHRGRSPPACSAAGRCGHEPRAPRARRGAVGNSRGRAAASVDRCRPGCAVGRDSRSDRGGARRGAHGWAVGGHSERISCDCDISRVITRGRSEVLDVGRATRTISAALWKALVVHDPHCTAPGATNHPNAAKDTTVGTGHKAAPRTWTISSFSAGTTTANGISGRPAPAYVTDSGEISQMKVPASSAFESRSAITCNRSRSGNRCPRSPCVPRIDASSCSGDWH